jgi:SAM-dependent methyltransferase
MPADAASPSPGADWYIRLADHLGAAYLQYEFAKGTVPEVDFLVTALSLKGGDRVLDVGTGPGRHAIELARRGLQVVGIDISSTFLSIARKQASDAGVPVSFFEMDAAELPFEDEFDAVISICEGAFGLGLDDLTILRSIRRALKPGGHTAVSAANVFYVLKQLKEGDFFDPVTSVYRRTVEGVVGEDGSIARFDMWNSCYTPRELEWIANGAGLDPDFVTGVSPGDFKGRTPSMDDPELLLLARKPT